LFVFYITAKITGFGLRFREQKNVIIKNITIEGSGDDGMEITEGSQNIWIDHCTFISAYDGLVDIKRGSSYITISFCEFRTHQKAVLIGHSDEFGYRDIGNLKVTLHHNWFNATGCRHPRVRFGEVHVFNNYYLNNNIPKDPIEGYGVASTCEADVLVESNYFQNVLKRASSGDARFF
jgi:pectate lyase